MSYEPKLFICNVRGLNDRARRTGVRSVVGTTGASIVCLQETKLAAVTLAIVMETLGADFDAYICLPADDTRGGVIVAWKSRLVQLDSAHVDANSVTAKVTPLGGVAPWWWLTCVYGPQDEADKIAFLAELRAIRAAHPGPWALCGDFNMIYRDEDKNNGNLNRRMMGRFRRFLNDCELKEIYLHGRCYTWSNERQTPTLVRLDRVFVTAAWEELHSSCSLRCLATVVADHCPLLLDCTTQSTGRKRFQFERFWLKLDGFSEVVQSAWEVIEGDPDPFRRLTAKLKRTARSLMSWSDKKIGCVKLQLMTAREVVLRLDVAMESRPLSPDERRLRARLKQAYLGLASLERTMARQRAKIAWLREGMLIQPSSTSTQLTAGRRTSFTVSRLRARSSLTTRPWPKPPSHTLRGFLALRWIGSTRWTWTSWAHTQRTCQS